MLIQRWQWRQVALGGRRPASAGWRPPKDSTEDMERTLGSRDHQYLLRSTWLAVAYCWAELVSSDCQAEANEE